MLAYHVLFVGLVVGTEAFFTGLSLLNVRYGARTARAEADWMRETLGVEDVEGVLDYQRARVGLSLLETWTTLALLLLALYAGVVTDVVVALTGTGLSPLSQGVAFVLLVLFADRVAGAPFSLYRTFVVEQQFDFNNQSPRLWLRDYLLNTVLALVIVGALAAVVLWFVETVSYWPVAGWALVVGFSLAMLVLKPRVIDPLFNDFTPVEESDLRDAVDEVFDRAGFTCDQVYEMDASKRSGHSNAYFVGFGRTKRVVLYDTLVEGMDVDAIQSVLAHELAHWKRNHIWKFVGLAAVQFAVVFAALGYLAGQPWVYDLFALPTEATYAGLFVAVMLVGPVLRLSAPLQNYFSLAYEREADAFAVEVMGARPMADALATLAADNMSNPFPHPWYETFHHDHPPIPERIRYVQEMGGEGDGADDATTEGDVPAAD
ncbi:M48 family metallopeptidase [Haloarchaeobius sp. HRN-SO-5]|uniref:M48 family metallopeptidase n=1 Tax=Haloarchaeobius sp. HRN-SO-5 TaxID=3446118 RepID=UPI003EB9A74E